MLEELFDIEGDTNIDYGDYGDADFVQDSTSKKRKFESVLDDNEDDLPFKYRHARNGLCSVRSEIYEVTPWPT